MTSSMTLTLPLRAQKTPSVILLTAFTLCYEDNPEALAHLLEKQTPLPLKNLFSNNEFMAYVVSKEPGPSVQYENLRPALTALRPWMKMSASGQKLLTFYKTFLQLHGQWVIATAEQTAFEIHTQLTQALYIDKDDKQLVAHLNKHVPASADKLANAPTLDRAQYHNAIDKARDHLKAKTFALADKLFTLKASNEFWTNHGRLLAAIHVSEKKIKELRTRKAARRSNLNETRDHNDSIGHRQMGTNGTRPHLPHVEDSVRDFTQEEKSNYFDFNESHLE